MAETLSTISFVSYIAAGIFLAVTVAIWFLFKIPSVIGDLSGHSAKKSIERIRKNNEKTGNKKFRTSKTNAARDKLTETMDEKKKERKNIYKTGVLTENKAYSHTAKATGLLIDDDETEELQEDNFTEPLRENIKYQAERQIAKVKLKMIEDVVFVHSKEVIE